MKAFNMANGKELTFDDNTTPEYACAYGYYVESMNMASWFFACNQDAAEQKRDRPRWLEKGGFVYGKHSVSLGDWAAMTK